MNTGKEAFERPELVAFVMADAFTATMREITQRDPVYGRQLLTEIEIRLTAMCTSLKMPSRDRESVDSLLHFVRQLPGEPGRRH